MGDNASVGEYCYLVEIKYIIQRPIHMRVKLRVSESCKADHIFFKKINHIENFLILKTDTSNSLDSETPVSSIFFALGF